MIRRIIQIDEEKCIGCGLCVTACHEGAIDMIDGKAKLMRENYCDGLGDCLPACPTNAISFEEREAPAYDEAAVLAAKKQKEGSLPCGPPNRKASPLRNSTLPYCVKVNINKRVSPSVSITDVILISNGFLSPPFRKAP